jgi:Protein of unknown function (DUF3311)
MRVLRAGAMPAGNCRCCGEIGSIQYKPRGTTVEPTDSNQAGRSWLWLILLIPYVALLWLPFYNDTRPSFGGFPFFYWYQFLWVPLTSLLIYIVYRGVK